MDGLGVDRFAILGYRTGAPIALEVAAVAPDRVVRLVLCGCPEYWPEQRRTKALPGHYQAVAADGSHLTKTWQTMRAVGDWATLEQIERLTVDDLRSTADPLWAHDAILEQDLRGRLRTLAMPALLLYGDGDRFLPWAPALLAQSSHGRQTVIPDTGPMLMLEAPSRFCDAVHAFLG